ncbi:hypothetical protein MAR_016695 [Mya arenaria]|uniref:Ribosomal protein S16 n=1 Tax=Mya arenaria TaxID=6604 RepID=A0ABY7ECQ9_MYAAR|nr:hypothetical protein MAR_016695 [Mya arenaria]
MYRRIQTGFHQKQQSNFYKAQMLVKCYLGIF